MWARRRACRLRCSTWLPGKQIQLSSGISAELAGEWNGGAERVEAVSKVHYDDLVLQEPRDVRPDPQATAELLAQKAMEAGMERFVDSTALH